MAGTQVRVSNSTHETLRALSDEAGESMQSVIEKAVDQYKRRKFLEGLSEDFRALREDREAWQEETEERELWENTLPDGVENE
jgi:hypothetical protein